MPQLTVSVEDVSMLDQIRQAISMLRGVSSVSLKRQTKRHEGLVCFTGG